MHIAIIIGQFPPGVVGGAEIQAQTWAKRLATRHRVTVLSRLDRRGQSPREERDGFTVVRLPVAPLPLWRAAADMRGIERTIAAMTPRPDVLLCFMTFLSGLAGVRAGRRLGIPAVVWVRGEAEYRLAERNVERFISPRVWSGARGVLVQSEWNRSELLRELERVDPEAASRIRPRLEVVPNGLALPEGPFPLGGRVLTVCRLIANKGVDDLIAACAEAGKPLTVAGDGPERPALEALARQRGADVRFEGFVDRTGLDRLFREASAFVLASHRGEGLPNAVLEAMSYARPVIVTPSGATRDLVRDGFNGLHVASGDRPALAAALRRLRAEPEYAASLGARARGTAERFAWDIVQARLDDVLERWAVKPRGRVCFYAPHLYPVVSGGRVLSAGGGEVQLALIAKGLVRRGFDVDVVTCDYGQKAIEIVGGVRLLRCWRPEAGWPVLRFFHPRLTRTIAALRRSRADVYLAKGLGLNAGLARDVAHSMGRRFVFVSGHDLDVSAGMPRVQGARDRWWARRGLLGADAVVVQTERQRELLRAGFGLDATVITNVVLLPAEAADPGVNDTVLWVGTYKASKRPDWFLRFAERHPELRCAMAGVIPPAPLTDRDYRLAVEAAARLPNLEVHGPIAHERMGEFYARGALFTHSSPEEGYPNTFLEAWSHGLPTITAFDPDDTLAREGFGECHATWEAWEAAILGWMRDPQRRREAGLRARAYVTKAHTLYGIAERYCALLDRVIDPAAPAPPPAASSVAPADAEPPAASPALAPVDRARRFPHRRRAIRVAFLQATLGVGGAERLVQALIRRMHPGLVTPLAVTLYEPGALGEELIAEDRTVVSRLAASRYDTQVGRRLRDALEAHAIDVVYVSDSPLPKFWMGLLRRQGPSPRVVLGYHSTGVHGHAVQHFMSRVAMIPVADRHVALSDMHRRYLVERFGLPQARTDVVPSGVDLTRFDVAGSRSGARAATGLPADAPLVGIVAALRPEKDHALFLKAARRVADRFPGARFVLVGDGPTREAVERARDELSLGDRVLMLGARTDVPALLRAVDVVVLSSRSETLPLTLMEAAASATPVVSTDVGSVRELVRDGETGFLVPVGDDAALGARIGDLLGDAALRKRMGDAGRDLAESQFDERAMIRKYERLFRDVAEADA